MPAEGAMRTVLVLSGGPTTDAVAPLLPPAEDLGSFSAVIAADSGLHIAAALDVAVDVVVGDMDSVDPHLLAIAERNGAEARRFPADKDASDFELAMEVALELHATHVVVVGSDAGRLDHLLVGISVMASPRWSTVTVEGWLGPNKVTVIRSTTQLLGRSGATVTLMATHGAVTDVHSEGLRWNLSGDTLLPGSSRGVSNEFAGASAEVRVGTGCLVAVQPSYLGSEGHRVGPASLHSAVTNSPTQPRSSDERTQK